ncbi:MAG: extracellular solute-binding protein [Oscillospiraceae bacterium]|nr:extracellular solute-binding protein [Oscillospiraceae bacterium]
MKNFLKVSVLMALILSMLMVFCGCGSKKEEIIIYTSAENYRIEYMWQRLEEEFPEYDILIEYMPTGNHAARLFAEGTESVCDIVYDLEYTYLEQLAKEGILADLSGYDFSVFTDDTVKSSFYMADYRNGGAVAINKEMLEKQGLEVPKSYEDLLDPKYKGLVSMPNPLSSGTGYMFLLAMVNELGEEAAFEYFDKLSENILQFTSSGSGPINALVQREVAIGLTSTGVAVNAINEGAEIEIIYFDEGSPYSLYGQAIVAGKENDPAVKAVFDFLYETYLYENCEKFFPEQIFKDVIFEVENYPKNITYCNMEGDSAETKEYLLSKWKY